MSAVVISQMKAQIERQAETIRLLRAAIVPDQPLPAEWNLTRRESQIFVLLARRERQSLDALHGAIYVSSGEDDVQSAVIQSHVSKMRTKLRRFGVEIEAKRHQGYRLVNRERYQHFSKAMA